MLLRVSLPKDVASINYISRKNKIMTPLFSSIESNNNHIDLIYKQIKSFSQKKLDFAVLVLNLILMIAEKVQL